MSLIEHMALLESANFESAKEIVHQAYSIPGIGDFIKREFIEARTPSELAMGISGMAKELDNSMKSGDMSVLQDYGLTTHEDVIKFRRFAMQVIHDPSTFYGAMHNNEATLEEDSMDATPQQQLVTQLQHDLRTQEVIVTKTHGAEKEQAERQIVDILTQLRRLGVDI